MFSDSFKRSFKRSGSISRRNSFRKGDRTPSQEHLNDSTLFPTDVRTSTNSLTNTNLTPSGPNLSGILDSNYIDSSMINVSSSILMDEDDQPFVERIETADGHVHDIRLYQVYLLGMSGTGKCSLLRQFKTTEYRGIYDYSSSVGKLMDIVRRTNEKEIAIDIQMEKESLSLNEREILSINQRKLDECYDIIKGQILHKNKREKIDVQMGKNLFE